MLAAQALGACRCRCTRTRWPPSSSFPINNAEVRFAVVEDQEQVDKLLEIREQCPQLRASGSTTRAACASTTSRAGIAG
jgi:long-chain acyl-CoA synthetase